MTGGSGRVGDTSQKGNWSCFRNEILNSTTPISISYRTSMGDLPCRGILVGALLDATSLFLILCTILKILTISLSLINKRILINDN